MFSVLRVVNRRKGFVLLIIKTNGTVREKESSNGNWIDVRDYVEPGKDDRLR